MKYMKEDLIDKVVKNATKKKDGKKPYKGNSEILYKVVKKSC